MEQKNEQDLVITEQKSNGVFRFPPEVFTPQKEVEAPKTTSPTPSEVVEQIFNGAVVQAVTNDNSIKEEIVDSAKDAIHNKTRAIKDKMEAEAKEAHFNNNKGACECFGFTETSTEKWAVSIMKVWHRIMTAIWIVIGFFTYAPITFIAQKVGVIIKKTWIAVVVSGIIYLAIATSPLWLSLLSK